MHCFSTSIYIHKIPEFCNHSTPKHAPIDPMSASICIVDAFFQLVAMWRNKFYYISNSYRNFLRNSANRHFFAIPFNARNGQSDFRLTIHYSWIYCRRLDSNQRLPAPKASWLHCTHVGSGWNRSNFDSKLCGIGTWFCKAQWKSPLNANLTRIHPTNEHGFVVNIVEHKKRASCSSDSPLSVIDHDLSRRAY